MMRLVLHHSCGRLPLASSTDRHTTINALVPAAADLGNIANAVHTQQCQAHSDLALVTQLFCSSCCWST